LLRWYARTGNDDAARSTVKGDYSNERLVEVASYTVAESLSWVNICDVFLNKRVTWRDLRSDAEQRGLSRCGV
jgi:hypothetical protein